MNQLALFTASSPPVPDAEPSPSSSPATQVRDFGEKIGGARKDLALLRPSTTTTPKVVDDEGEADDDSPAWRRKYSAMEPNEWRAGGYVPSGRWILLRDGRQATRDTYATEAEALAPNVVELAEVARNHRIYFDREKNEWSIHRRIGDRKCPVVKSGFKSEDEAKLYMVMNTVEIIEFRFTFPEVPWLDAIVRQGPGYRTGNGHVTPEMFQSAFGFRGGEFGNWNQGTEGQAALNHAYDALQDLARVLNLPPAAVSLRGGLAIAFGARGHGGKDSARAHYERGYRVINLTKIHGAGSLAHEWMHALDHFLGVHPTYAGGKPETHFASERFTSRTDTVSPAVRDAFLALQRCMTVRDVTKPIDVTRAQAAVKSMNEHVEEKLRSIRHGFIEYPAYKKRKPPTDAQLAQFDALAARIAALDLGKPVTIHDNKPTGRRFSYSLGRDSYERVEELNVLYKSVVGRSFATKDEHSAGRSLMYGLGNLKRTLKRVENASQGATETYPKPTAFLQAARDIDARRASDYWSTPHEMLARAFASYIAEKLGARSDYLVYGAANWFYILEGTKPYPEGDELKAINTAFDTLFQTIASEKLLS